MASDPTPSRPRLPIGLMVIGSEMVTFTLLGLLLDYLLNTLPGFTIGLTILGFVASFSQLVRLARKMGQPSSSSGSGGSGSSSRSSGQGRPGDANRGPR